MASTYQIRSGDTLSKIAEFHKTTVDKLMAINPVIEDPDKIFTGQTINVPETPEEGESIHAALAGGEGPLWYQIAVREMNTGIDEIPGHDAHNPRIVEYHQATSLKATDDETAWCSSFINWCMMKAGQERTNNAMARSWLNWGKKLDPPEKGCVVVFSRPPNPASGHVALFEEIRGDRIFVLGGNQSNQVNISSYPRVRLLDYRWPAS